MTRQGCSRAPPCWALGWVLTPAIFAAIFMIVPGHERGAAAGTATIFIDLGFGGGALLLGWIASAGGIPLAFLAAAALTAVAVPLLLTSPLPTPTSDGKP